MEEFDIREATPEDAEKIIAYLAQVGGETDYLSFGKEGLPISTEEEEKFIQNINKEEHSVLYGLRFFKVDNRIIEDDICKTLNHRSYIWSAFIPYSIKRQRTAFVDIL